METAPRQSRRLLPKWRIGRFGVLMTALATASSSPLHRSPHATLAAPLTSAFLDSEPNDPAGGGQQLSLSTVTDTSGTARHDRFHQLESLGVRAHRDGQPRRRPSASRSFPGTTKTPPAAPRNAGQPLITVTADGNACTSFSGRFIVDEITTNVAGNLLTFSARFEQHCNGGDPALFGALSYNATADFRTVTISPSSIDFGMRGNDFVPSPPQTITITNNGPSTLTVFQTAITGRPECRLQPDSGNMRPPVTLASGESCTVNVTFTGFGPEGPRTAKLTDLR